MTNTTEETNADRLGKNYRIYPFRYEWHYAAGAPKCMTAWMHPENYHEPDPKAWAEEHDASTVEVVYAHAPRSPVMRWTSSRGLEVLDR